MPFPDTSPLPGHTRLVAGLGCRRDVPAEEIVELIKGCLAEVEARPTDLALIATLDTKAGEPAIVAAAVRFGVPVKAIAAADLAGFEPDLPTSSPVVAAHTGLAGVAEAAAMTCGELVLAKRRSARATCALARLRKEHR